MNKPTVVVLCGSTRFRQAFEDANARETLAGKIVLSVGVFNSRSLANADDSATAQDNFSSLPPQERDRFKSRLDELHLRKIDMADEVLILDVDGYMGESTRRELAYAREHGKRVRFLSEESTNERT